MSKTVNKEDRKKIVKALKTVQVEYCSLSLLAKESGVPIQQIRVFLASGSLRQDKVEKICEWFVAKGYDIDQLAKKAPQETLKEDTLCLKCGSIVPGPLQGVNYCNGCGGKFIPESLKISVNVVGVETRSSRRKKQVSNNEEELGDSSLIPERDSKGRFLKKVA